INANCINQEDVDERNQQIQLMCHIYIRCNRLVVWLGLACDNGHLAAEFLERLVQKTINEDSLKVWAAEVLASVSFIDTYIAILRLLRSPWFN
ncbi:hypothetical protein BKA65DRAFT_402503, partial [Rhexocercosporidium sp. MPI-PUGE-AT-0058]